MYDLKNKRLNDQKPEAMNAPSSTFYPLMIEGVGPSHLLLAIKQRQGDDWITKLSRGKCRVVSTILAISLSLFLGI